MTVNVKRDQRVIRTVINKLLQGPSLHVYGSESYARNMTAQDRIAMAQEVTDTVRLWAKTWLISELNDLLPVEERVRDGEGKQY